jgi:hypothetical protein
MILGGRVGKDIKEKGEGGEVDNIGISKEVIRAGLVGKKVKGQDV